MKKVLRSRTSMGKYGRKLLLMLCLIMSFAAYAQETPAPAKPQSCTSEDYYNSLGRSENSGGYDGCNSIGCCGKYQVCPPTLAPFLQRNGITKDEFMNGTDPSTGMRWQETIVRQFTDGNQTTLNNGGAQQYVGQTINGVTITNSGLLGGSHLGGATGTLKYLKTGGTYNPFDGPDGKFDSPNRDQCISMANSGMSVKDRNATGLKCGTRLSEYITKFQGYDTANGEGEGNCSNAPGNATNTMGPICAEDIRAEVSRQMQGGLAKREEFVNMYMTPPAQLSQVANTPCMSQELQRINNQFGGMVRSLNGAITISGNGAGPVSNIMNNSFKGDTNTFNSSASILPGMLNFQSIASNALGGLLSQLGLGDAFSGRVCGIMLDMLLKYIQCENPIKFPNLSGLLNLNLNLPNNCAGQAARVGLQGLASSKTTRALNQAVSQPGIR